MAIVNQNPQKPFSFDDAVSKREQASLDIKQGHALKNWVGEYLMKRSIPGSHQKKLTEIVQPYICH